METFVKVKNSSKSRVTCTVCTCTILTSGKSRHLKTKKHLRNMPKKHELDEQDKDNECPICYDVLVKTNTKTFRCGHNHCKTCSKKITKCSICRQPLSVGVVERPFIIMSSQPLSVGVVERPFIIMSGGDTMYMGYIANQQINIVRGRVVEQQHNGQRLTIRSSPININDVSDRVINTLKKSIYEYTLRINNTRFGWETN